MNSAAHVLIVEDVPSDAELVYREVKRVLPQSECQVVETQEDYVAALASFCPDLILSDYALPVFDGLMALRLAREQAPQTPFIMVTGEVDP